MQLIVTNYIVKSKGNIIRLLGVYSESVYCLGCRNNKIISVLSNLASASDNVILVKHPVALVTD